MKYLKEYKLFESNDINLKSVEEAFYDISDKLNVSVLIGDTELFTTATEYNYALSQFPDKVGHINLIKISIQSEKVIGITPSVSSYFDIKDDLDFAVDYVTNELGLSLLGLFIYNSEYSVDSFNVHYKRKLKNMDIENFRLINLFFYKKVHRF